MLQLFLQTLDQGIFIHCRGWFGFDLDVFHCGGKGQSTIALNWNHRVYIQLFIWILAAFPKPSTPPSKIHAMEFFADKKKSAKVLSSKFANAGLKVPIIEVLELPLKALDNKSVNLEFRKRDIKALVGEAPTAILLRLSGLAKAWMQVDNHIKLWLMKVSSTSLSPETLAFNRTSITSENW